MFRFKTMIRLAACLFAAFLIAILTYFYSGSSAIESWVGSQLLEIGATYLQPNLQFQRLTYVRPRTILLDNLTLSSPDPSDATKTVAILSVKHAQLELTEIPRRGKPIKFSQIILDSPEFHGIALQPGGAGLIGFSNLVKGAKSPAANSAPTTVPTPDTTTAVAANTATAPASHMNLSDFLLIRHLEIKNGIASYDPREPDMPPILLDGINAKLEFAPTDAKNPGLYKISTNISRKPAVDMNIQGSLDINTLIAVFDNLDLTLDLQQKNAHLLPPQLQKLLQTFEVTGLLHATVKGTLPLADWTHAALEAKYDLTDARVAVGQNGLSIKSWNFQAAMADGIVTVQKADADLLGGTLNITGTLPVNGATSAQLNIIANDLKIQRLLRAQDPNVRPAYAGNFAAQINYNAPLAAWNKQAAGAGAFSIRQGRIDNLPVIGDLTKALAEALKLTLGTKPALNDSADGKLSFAGDALRIDEFTGTAGPLAMRATGTIGFNQQLNLRLNGGPLETLQKSLGPFGKIWGNLSDNLAGYQVTGTLKAPQMSLAIGSGH